MTGIYKITNLINNKIYIGSAVDFSKRKSRHFVMLLRNNHCNLKLQNAYNKYGLENFKFEIIEYCEKEYLIEREQYYMNLLKPHYNICKTAGSSLGFKQSQETIEKRKLSNKGYKHSEEIKEKIRIANIGKIYSEEYKNRLSKISTERYISGLTNSIIGAKGSENQTAKLTEDQVINIKKDLFKGKTVNDIIINYPNVSEWAIYNIKQGRSWKHVTI